MNEKQRISKTEIDFYLREKKNFKSPDINKMQMVEINQKTKLYIAIGASADEARKRYMEYEEGKKRF